MHLNLVNFGHLNKTVEKYLCTTNYQSEKDVTIKDAKKILSEPHVGAGAQCTGEAILYSGN